MKLISTMILVLATGLASAPAPAGVVVSAGFHGGHGGFHGGHVGYNGWHGGYHGGYHCCYGGGVRFGVVIGPPFWGPWPWYYPPSYSYPPTYYAPPPVVYTNPPVIVTPSQPAYTPPLAAPGTAGNPVVELPPTSTGPTPAAAQQYSPPPTVAQAQAAPAQLFMYPRQNQDAQLQARDRDECYHWALGQLGYDPGKSTAGLSPSQSSDYYRAMTACLDGRGYSVR